MPSLLFLCKKKGGERMPQNRDSAGRFQKGKSGNPGGRPKVPDNIKKALSELAPESIELKRQILLDENAPLDLKNKVADSILDRVYGKPGYAVEDASGDTLAKLDAMIAGFKNVVNTEAE